MANECVVFFKNQIVTFRPDEIEDISSRSREKVWNVFTNTSKNFYSKNNNFGKNDLKTQGFEFIKAALSKEDVLALKKEWNDHFIPWKISRDSDTLNLAKEEKDSYSVVNYQVAIRSLPLISEIVIKILNPKITTKIENYLESHFAISHVMFAEAFPDAAPITSFRWHYDVGPSSQTHIMVYLDDADETGGRTEFLNYDDSQKIRDSGYNPIVASERLLDITDIDPSVEVIKPSPEVGDMIIFNATKIYHCGIHPTKKTRKVVFIILHSDFAPWTETAHERNIFNYPVGRFIYNENPFFTYLKDI